MHLQITKLLLSFSLCLIFTTLCCSAENGETLANFKSGEDRYAITVEVEQDIASMILKKNGLSIAADTMLFPLKTFGVSEAVAKGLAESYVEREISKSSKVQVQARIAAYDAIPEDLHQAYSEHFEIQARKIYGATEEDELGLTSNLRNLGLVDQKEFSDRFAKSIAPHRLDLMVGLTSKPDTHLAKALLQTYSKFSTRAELQPIVLVYLARQPEHFSQVFALLEPSAQRSIREGVNKGLDAKLLGKSLREKARATISSL